MLEKNGWYDIKIEPAWVLDSDYLEKVKPTLNKKFRNPDSSELRMINIMVMARKG